MSGAITSGQLNNIELALSLAQRGNLPGAEALVMPKFDMLFNSGNFKAGPYASPHFSAHLWHFLWDELGRVILTKRLRLSWIMCLTLVHFSLYNSSTFCWMSWVEF